MKILLTAFQGTSAERLVAGAKYDILHLPNDKKEDTIRLIESLKNPSYQYVFCFGQRPNIKDKICIETTAKDKKTSYETGFPCLNLQTSMESQGLCSKLSSNAGTSFCNQLYFGGLKYIAENKSETKIVFIHIPFEKNISNMDEFRTKIFQGIEAFINEKEGK